MVIVALPPSKWQSTVKVRPMLESLCQDCSNSPLSMGLLSSAMNLCTLSLGLEIP